VGGVGTHTFKITMTSGCPSVLALSITWTLPQPKKFLQLQTVSSPPSAAVKHHLRIYQHVTKLVICSPIPLLLWCAPLPSHTTCADQLEQLLIQFPTICVPNP
jgi:hypothetical protein